MLARSSGKGVTACSDIPPPRRDNTPQAPARELPEWKRLSFQANQMKRRLEEMARVRAQEQEDKKNEREETSWVRPQVRPPLGCQRTQEVILGPRSQETIFGAKPGYGELKFDRPVINHGTAFPQVGGQATKICK